MFELDKSISQWRQQMATAGVGDSGVLNELESHLRDDVDQHERAGLSARQAFEAAVQQIGPAIELRNEFQKAMLKQPMKLETHKLLRAILFTAAIIAIATGLDLPVLAKWREQQTLAGFDVAMLLIGGAMFAFAAVFAASTVFKRRKA